MHFKDSKGNLIKTVEANEGDDILAIAHEYDIDLEGACEGSVACSTCHVILEPDVYDKLPEPEDDENDMLDMAFGLTDTSRLGCQVKLTKELDGLTATLPSATRNMFVDVRMSSLSSNQAAEDPDKSGWSASQYNKSASFVYSAAYTSPVLELLSAKPGERIIDFGCGSGEVTLELERVVRPSGGCVVGVDASESMIHKAKKNGLEHAFVADIQALESIPVSLNLSNDKFDAVFTNAALHWCKRDPEGVIKSAKQLLKKSGRFVGEMGGFMNCIGVRSALHLVTKRRGYDSTKLDPWFFPSPEEYSKLLKSQGFDVTHISLTPRFTPLPQGMMSWLRLFARNSWLSGIEEAEATDILKEVEDICRVDCQDGDGNWAFMSTQFDPENAQNMEEIEKQFAVRAVEQAQAYWNLLGKVPPKDLKLTQIDDEIFDDLMKTFPELAEPPHEKLAKLDEDWMKSKEGKERWRNFINRYEKKVQDFNFGCLVRIYAAGEYNENNTMFVTLLQVNDIYRSLKTQLTRTSSPKFYAIEIARNRLGLNDKAHEIAKSDASAS
ncbi:hypothetical protein VNI00_002330 [Paramarasmius palmivorus]|uniref:2Fe-2S ferredoxin-type domain-containing protein n=1 Tax=Paramarasmius palmivorus TaxID=297713 RepID=A0AAW0DWP1_9AGAR